MIGRLTGNIIHESRNPIIVDVHGVGYVVYIPDAHLQSLITTAPQTLYIHTHVREDALDLYGFLKEEDLKLFEQLLTVSGIGPKTALGIISKGTQKIIHAVQSGNADFFTSVPRLGKKNAQKIIIELKNKITSSGTDSILPYTEDTEELKNALISMGFSKPEILRALESMPESTDRLEIKLRNVLKILGSKK